MIGINAEDYAGLTVNFNDDEDSDNVEEIRA